jgi:hypothetical protein
MVYLLDRSDFELGRDFCPAQQVKSFKRNVADENYEGAQERREGLRRQPKSQITHGRMGAW